MLDLAEQIARTVDAAVVPVTADEARGRASARTHFRRTAVLASALTGIVVLAAIIAALVALGVGRHSKAVIVRQPSATSPRVIADPPTTAPLGAPIGRIVIPRIDESWIFVQGTRAQDEAIGPIHDPESPLPGQPGNVVITGHRTTHGAPFFRLDELRRGDVIQITTTDGGFTYYVDGSFVVSPEGDSLFPANVLARVAGRTKSLTLIANTPKYSSAQRLVVTASR